MNKDTEFSGISGGATDKQVPLPYPKRLYSILQFNLSHTKNMDPSKLKGDSCVTSRCLPSGFPTPEMNMGGEKLILGNYCSKGKTNVNLKRYIPRSPRFEPGAY